MIKDEEIEIYLEILNNSQQSEDDFFKSSASMCSNKYFYKKVFHKMRSLWLFKEIINKYDIDLSGKVLELAGGYGAQAAYLKQIKGDDIELYYSDCSLTAVKASDKFETFFESKIDHKWVIEAENIPVPDNYFDNIYFFAGFHHVQDVTKAISECHRALKVGGRLVLMLEPSCPNYLSPLYEIKVKRDKIAENFFTRRDYDIFFKNIFADYQLNFFTNYYNRESKLALIYYFVLSLLPKIVVRLFPSSVVVVAKK